MAAAQFAPTELFRRSNATFFAAADAFAGKRPQRPMDPCQIRRRICWCAPRRYIPLYTTQAGSAIAALSQFVCAVKPCLTILSNRITECLSHCNIFRKRSRAVSADFLHISALMEKIIPTGFEVLHRDCSHSIAANCGYLRRGRYRQFISEFIAGVQRKCRHSRETADRSSVPSELYGHRELQSFLTLCGAV